MTREITDFNNANESENLPDHHSFLMQFMMNMIILNLP